MNRSSWWNLGGVLLAVLLGLTGLSVAGRTAETAQTTPAKTDASDRLAVEPLPDGSFGLRDETGVLVPLRTYSRILSASTVSDALLLEFAAPSQIAAFTAYSADNQLFGYKYAGKPQIDALKNIEALLALEPDLLLVSTLSSGSRLERLRETGLTIFSLGEMRGVEAYLRNARAIAALVGRPEVGELYASATLRRFRSIAPSLPDEERKTAIQLTYYGNKIYGSGANTSYSDVMRYAGLTDLGAQRYTDWPAWSPEQVLELDPQVVITRTGMGHQLCTQPTLATLQACRLSSAGTTGIIELPDALINDPGPGMLLSAELIHAAAYESAANGTLAPTSSAP